MAKCKTSEGTMLNERGRPMWLNMVKNVWAGENERQRSHTEEAWGGVTKGTAFAVVMVLESQMA